jgi:hypothetical protein
MLYQLSYAREARILAVPDLSTSADRLDGGPIPELICLCAVARRGVAP